ncbi:nucleoside deaminase [Salinicola sp. DM10]|uniref:nucleoside deaminase n=1 Tax=Salinicola sp. DM10 TaxID=2815721 RepID=UPI001A8E250E|nr:nucleoside deaminase [Salinicola sp. DM10]MCE3026633.1 nucleoside deaminase [Salinicola sp. DM10]
MSDSDIDQARFLARAVALAEAALEAGDEPFGSVLVSDAGEILAEDRNRISGGDATRHPEFALARWAAENLSPEARVAATVYTSGEHCPMCAAAHGWVGLGRIVYASSAAQLMTWLGELGQAVPPVAPLPITAVVPGLQVEGPVAGFDQQVRALHRRRHGH